MENLLDYVIYALLGHEYTVNRRSMGQWMVIFEERVYLVFDDADISVLRRLVNESNDADTIERVNKLLSLLV